MYFVLSLISYGLIINFQGMPILELISLLLTFYLNRVSLIIRLHRCFLQWEIVHYFIRSSKGLNLRLVKAGNEF
jgi:hypothetical protein